MEGTRANTVDMQVSELEKSSNVQLVISERIQPNRSECMQERMEFLKKDLQNLFNDKGVDKSQYDSRVEFMDPITKYGSVQGEFHPV